MGVSCIMKMKITVISIPPVSLKKKIESAGLMTSNLIDEWFFFFSVKIIFDSHIILLVRLLISPSIRFYLKFILNLFKIRNCLWLYYYTQKNYNFYNIIKWAYNHCIQKKTFMVLRMTIRICIRPRVCIDVSLCVSTQGEGGVWFVVTTHAPITCWLGILANHMLIGYILLKLAICS